MTNVCEHEWWRPEVPLPISVCLKCGLGLKWVKEEWVFQEYVSKDMLDLIRATMVLKKAVEKPLQRTEQAAANINHKALKVLEAARNLKANREAGGKEAL